MSTNKENSGQYSAADILMYLKGEMTPGERHALEKAALDDPFLADAIEGMDAATHEYGESKVMARLEELKKEIERKKYKTAPVIRMTSGIWKVAAAAAVLLIASVFVLNYFLNDSRKDNLAVTQTTNKESKDQNQSEESTSSQSLKVEDSNRLRSFSSLDSTTPSLTKSPKTSKKKFLPSSKENKKDIIDSRAVQPDEEVSVEPNNEKIETNIASAPPAKADIGKSKDLAGKAVSKDAKVPAASRVNENPQNATVYNFSGKVVDNNYAPIANASIRVPDFGNRFLTDKNGNFQIPSGDTVLNVEIAHVGFEEANFQLRNNVASNPLVLKPSNRTLNEAVVSGVDQGRSTKKESKISIIQNAEPVGGWEEYENYLRANRYSNLKTIQSGEVIVSFDITKSGELSDFKIEKSLSRENDLEAIRLIRTGPSWKAKKGKKTRATVIVRF